MLPHPAAEGDPQTRRSTTNSQVVPTVAHTPPALMSEAEGSSGSPKMSFGGSDRIGIPKAGNACRIPLACQLGLAVSAKSRSFRHRKVRPTRRSRGLARGTGSGFGRRCGSPPNRIATHRKRTRSRSAITHEPWRLELQVVKYQGASHRAGGQRNALRSGSYRPRRQASCSARSSKVTPAGRRGSMFRRLRSRPS